MKKNLKRLAIIPARKDSKRIPNKNILNFFGKPMIEYTIDTALKSNIFDKIHISTNCNKTKSITEKKGLKFDFFRPEELCSDSSKLIDVLSFVLEQFYKEKMYFDEVWLMMACAPLIESEDLINACRQFQKQDISSGLMAAAKFPTPIEWAYKLSSKKRLVALNNFFVLQPSQSFEDHFYDAGIFYAYKSEHLLGSNPVDFKNYFVPFILSPFKAIDIDNFDDLKIAENLFKLKNILKEDNEGS